MIDIMRVRSRRATRIGRRASWPVNVGLARYAGRVCGAFVRVGDTTVVAAWLPR